MFQGRIFQGEPYDRIVLLFYYRESLIDNSAVTYANLYERSNFGIALIWYINFYNNLPR